MEEERKTIAQWGKETGMIVIDPDGFDRTDMQLFERLFTKAEFTEGAIMSSCIIDIRKITGGSGDDTI